MEKIGKLEKVRKFFGEASVVKATVPMVFYWAVVWLSFFGFMISPYTEIVLAVISVYCLFVSLRTSGFRVQLPAAIFLCIYTGFGFLSFLYNGNAGVSGVIMPAVFICFSVFLLNVKLKTNILKMLCALSCFVWFVFSFYKIFSSSGGLYETTLNLGFGYVFLFFCIYAVCAYRYKEPVSPYLPAVCFIFSLLLLCREGIAVFGVLTAAFVLFDFRDGRTFVRDHPVFFSRAKKVFTERLRHPERAAALLFFFSAVFILSILYFIKITTTGFIIVPKNGVLGGKIIESAISDVFVSSGNLFLGTKESQISFILNKSEFITSSFFYLHSNYGLGMFVSVMAYTGLAFYRYFKTRNYLYFLLLGATGVRMFFDGAAFPGFSDVVLIFFLLFPYYDKAPEFPVPAVLSKVKVSKTVYHDKIYFCLCSVLTAMFILKLYAPKSVVIDIISLICMALLVFNPLYTIPPLLIVNFFNQAFFFQGIPYAVILSFVFILGLLIHYKRTAKKIPLKYIAFSAFLIIWFFLSAAFGYTHRIDYACVMGANILFILMMSFYSSDKKNIEWAIKTLFFSCSVILITVFIVYIFGGGFFREGHFTLNTQTNPNSFAKGVVQLAAIFFGGLIVFRKMLHKLACAFMIVLAVFLVFLSGSRSAFLAVTLGAAAVLLVYSFFTKAREYKTEWKIILSLISVGALMYILLWFCDFDIMRRFTLQNVLASGGTGRMDIWKVILTKIVPDNFFFGVGFGEENVMEAVARYSTIRPNYSHNFVLGVLAQLGVVGSIVFFVPYVRMMVTIIKERFCNRYMPVFAAMLSFALFNGIGEGIVDLQAMWIAVAVALFLVNAEGNKQRALSEERRYWGIF